jgi:hypothetical protein
LSRSVLREIESGTAEYEAVTAPQLYILISQVGVNFWSREKLSFIGGCAERWATYYVMETTITTIGDS